MTGRLLRWAFAALLVAGASRSTLLAEPAPPDYRTWFLAEGATGSFFDLYILIANPNSTPADIKITYLLPQGSTAPLPQTFTIPGTSRKTVHVNAIPGLENTAVSAVVDCTNDLPIVVERTMLWPGAGKWLAGHNSVGVTAASTHWFLAEGAAGFFDDFVLIANPDPVHAAEVKVRFLLDLGRSPVTKTYTIPPATRYNIWVNNDFPQLTGTSFSTDVESTNGIGVVVERAMYWGQNWKGGHESAGIAALSNDWYFAEGFTGSNPSIGQFSTWILLANPDTTQTANVQATYFRDDGTTVPASYQVPPSGRLTIYANAVTGLQDSAFSTHLHSDIPIASERAMYWGPGGTWVEGHDTSGVTAPSTKWGFAEGTSENGFDTYILVNNPDPSPITVHATFMLEDGTGITKDYKVPAQSRFNIVPGQWPELWGRRYATFLESTCAAPGPCLPFVAERAVYWGASYYGGHSSAGVPWPDAAAIGVPPVATGPAAPTVTSITPASGLAPGGTTVTITGANFLTGATVTIGGTQATSVTIAPGNSTTITAVTGPHAAGKVDVTITNRDGQTATLAASFTYVTPVPILSTPNILGFGDSITMGETAYLALPPPAGLIGIRVTTPYTTYLQEQLQARYTAQTITVQNAGEPGEWASDGASRLPGLLTPSRNLVILLEGVNDINAGVSVSTIASALQTMVQTAKAQGKKVILCTLTPTGYENGFPKSDDAEVQQLNARIVAVAQAQDVVLADLYAAIKQADPQLTRLISPDGLHPTDAGYQKMAQVLYNLIVTNF